MTQNGKIYQDKKALAKYAFKISFISQPWKIKYAIINFIAHANSRHLKDCLLANPMQDFTEFEQTITYPPFPIIAARQSK